MSIERLLAVPFLAAVLIGAGVVATDSLYYGPKEEGLADALAAASQALANQPQSAAALSHDLQEIDNDSMMSNKRNVADLTTASDVGLKFWNVHVVRSGQQAGLDLGKTWGRAILDGAIKVATAKVNPARAVIDNRDPAVGPVLVYDRLRDTEFSALMNMVRANGWDKPGGLPTGFLIVVDFFGPGKAVEVDSAGDKVLETRFGDLIKESPWNPALRQDDGPVRGILRHLIPGHQG